MKRTNIYKANNVTFNPTTLDAFSYDWWQFVGVVEGKVIFNNYNYSPTTRKHQHKVRRLLNELGIKIDIEMPIPSGLPKSHIQGAVFGVLDTVKRSELSLSDLIKESEEFLCQEFVRLKLKDQDNYYRRKEEKTKKEIEQFVQGGF